MNTYHILIDIIDQAIIDDDVEVLKENLSRLPFEKLNQSTIDLLLSHFINLCRSTHCIKVIFNIWYEYLEVKRGELDHLTRLFTDITVDEDQLKLVASTFEDKPIEYYFEFLIDYDSLPITIIAAKNLEQIFPDAPWAYIYVLSVDNELKKGYTNRLIKDFIENKLSETREYSEKPEWVNDKLDTSTDFHFLKNNLRLNFEESLNLTINEITDTQVIEILGENSYNDLDEEEKKELLRPHMLNIYRYNMMLDDTLFRVFGPSNTQITDLEGNGICSIYGGHRMLLCNEFDDSYLNDEEIDNDKILNDFEWFTGRCDQCFNPIKYPHYALRKPLQTGGWIGCYDTFNCVKFDVPTNTIQYELIEIIEEQILRIGIQDRNY